MNEAASAAPLFLDTSALLRAYLFKDPFYGQVQQAISQTQQVVVSGLAYPEFTTALMQRQHRDHPARLTAAQVARVLSDFQRDWDTLYVVSVDEALLYPGDPASGVRVAGDGRGTSGECPARGGGF